MMFFRIAVAFLAVAAPAPKDKHPEPVAAIANQGLRLTTPQGSATDPLILSFDWPKPQPHITRAVIIIHGKGRDVEGNYRNALEAADLAGSAAHDTVFVAPQFLDEEDVDAHRLAPDILRWKGTGWTAGAPATAPISLSSYDVIDAILVRLVDHSFFPDLKTIVLAGHSAGGQFLQRYAIVGHALPAFSANGIHLHFVIANPSSYLYFTEDRPAKNGELAPFSEHSCPNFNHWRHGILDPPPYVQLDADHTWPKLESDYAQRDVTYLLGTDDTDPHQKDLDVTCAGEAEGPTRFARGQAYYAYLHARNRPSWNQRLWFVPGVAHSSREMFTSKCGVSAIFETNRCPDQ